MSRVGRNTVDDEATLIVSGQRRENGGRQVIQNMSQALTRGTGVPWERRHWIKSSRLISRGSQQTGQEVRV
jgi:hypothetical protein